MKDLTKLKQKVAKLERQYALAKIKERKLDARRKIEFGGLVIKANMGEYAKDVILGALIHSCELLKKDSSFFTLYESKGKSAFLKIVDISDG